MAQRRMFNKSITNSSKFLKMPMSSRLLYYDLGMNADDDGFVEHFMVLRMTGATEQDLGVLEINGLVKIFDENVLWIKDWKENNYIRNDRYVPSKYLSVYNLETLGIPEVSTGKDSIGKISIDNINNMSDLENEFEELWKLYPKKVGKKNALKHYIKSRKGKTTYENVLNGINKYNEYISKTNTPVKYIKDGSSWFNQESWNDERILELNENNVPEWFGKEIGWQEMSKEDLQEIDNILDDLS